MDVAGECLQYYDEEKRRKGGGIIECQPSCRKTSQSSQPDQRA
jgi:hypothetical protein